MINYIIGFGVAALVVFIVLRGISRKKQGKSSGCGCGSSSWSSCSGCSGCSSSSCSSSHENEGE